MYAATCIWYWHGSARDDSVSRLWLGEVVQAWLQPVLEQMSACWLTVR